MPSNDITDINVAELVGCLEDLHQRLVSNYNDGAPFEQSEEDRNAVRTALDIIEANIITNSNSLSL